MKHSAPRCVAPVLWLGRGLPSAVTRLTFAQRRGVRIRSTVAPPPSDAATRMPPIPRAGGLGLFAADASFPEDARSENSAAERPSPSAQRESLSDIVHREIAQLKAGVIRGRMGTGPTVGSPAAATAVEEGVKEINSPPQSYDVGGLQETLRTRLLLERDALRKDAMDVIRGSPLAVAATDARWARALSHLARLCPGSDPIDRLKHAELASRIARLRETDDQEGIVALLEGMDDVELSGALRAGALDPLDLLLDNGNEDPAEENEADPACGEFAAHLPNEYVAYGNHLSAIVRDVRDVALSPHGMSDDEARVVAKFRAEGPAAFSQEDLNVLSAYEKRVAEEHTVTPNTLLVTLAQRDERLRESLEVLDRAKRAVSRDARFREALSHAALQGKAAFESAAVEARPQQRRGAADNTYFFDPSHSFPPPNAGHQVPLPAEKKLSHGEERKRRRASIFEAHGVTSGRLFTGKKGSSPLI